jgi:hypothetical protein
MKLTKSQLKQIIKEEFSSNSDDALVSVLEKLLDKLEDLDISIDYLAAAATGDSPLGVSAAQDTLGRIASPSRRAKRFESLSEDTIKRIIEEETEKVLQEKSVSKSQQRFFGMVRGCQEEGDCPSDEVSKASDSMKKSDVKDFAKTKHKGLPEKKKKKK